MADLDPVRAAKIKPVLPEKYRERGVVDPDYTVVPVVKVPKSRAAPSYNVLCADCSIVLIENWPSNVALENLIIICPKCRTFNDIHLVRLDRPA